MKKWLLVSFVCVLGAQGRSFASDLSRLNPDEKKVVESNLDEDALAEKVTLTSSLPDASGNGGLYVGIIKKVQLNKNDGYRDKTVTSFEIGHVNLQADWTLTIKPNNRKNDIVVTYTSDNAGQTQQCYLNQGRLEFKSKRDCVK